jgi:phage FluMu protein Com
MVARQVIKCNYCNKKILLKVQVDDGYIPFYFHCPNCNVSIDGTINFSNKGELSLTNAKKVNRNCQKYDYYLNISNAFLCRKITKFVNEEECIENSFSPFIMTTMFFKSHDSIEKANEEIKKYGIFTIRFQRNIKTLYELYFSEKINLLEKPLKKISERFIIKNKLDAYMSLHQITVIGLSNLFEYDMLSNFTNIGSSIINPKYTEEIFRFIDYLDKTINFENLYHKVFDKYNEWFKKYEKLIPILIYYKCDNKEDLDKEHYGITTISFDDLKNFYTESYELILEMICIPIGLNNIYERGNFELFYKKSKAKDFTSFNELSKLDRIHAISDNEKFSKDIFLNKHVRNSVAHYDFNVDWNNQMVTFYDNNKGKVTIEKLYFIDIGLLCIENVEVICYLNELLYSITKLKFMREGKIPNIK